MLMFIGQLQVSTSLSPIKSMFVCLFDYFAMLYLVLVELLVNFTHFKLPKADDDLGM
jgi:hypothetical protein